MIKRFEIAKEKIIDQLNFSSIQEINKLAETAIRWYQEILNSFSIVKADFSVSKKDGKTRRKDYRLTSSMIENRNKLVNVRGEIKAFKMGVLRFNSFGEITVQSRNHLSILGALFINTLGEISIAIRMK